MAKLENVGEIDAIKHLGARVTIPLAYAKGVEFPWPIGSGTLVHNCDRLFILTAAHVFDGCNINRFWVPTDRLGGRPTPSGNAGLHRHRDPELFDIAVIEVLDPSVREVLRQNWGSISRDQIQCPTPDGTFILFGYPSEKLHQVDKTLMCSLITACTERLIDPPENATDPVDRDIDLFFLHDNNARDEDGELITSPHLRGASGGGIWEIREAETGTLWTAEKNMRLVGIQSSALHGEWFRAKTAVAALSAIQ